MPTSDRRSASTRAIVTGGAGFIGSWVADRLVDDGADVLVVDDLSRGRLERLSRARREGRVKIHQFDVRSPDLVDLFSRHRPDVVYHLAGHSSAPASVRDPMADASANVLGAINVIDTAVRAGVNRLVYVTSALDVYGKVRARPIGIRSHRRPVSPFGVGAGAVEEYLALYGRRHGLDWVALGTSTVYGPRQSPESWGGEVAAFVRKLLDGRPPVVHGTAASSRDLVYVDDVADACVRAGARGGKRYVHVAGGSSIRLVDVIEVLHRFTGRSLDPQFVDATEPAVEGAVFDIDPARKYLEWEPWTGLEDGLRATVAWFLGQG